MQISPRYLDNWAHEQQLTENSEIIADVSGEPDGVLYGQEISLHFIQIHLNLTSHHIGTPH